MLFNLMWNIVYLYCYKQLEVDEYRNYSKAVGALSEALKVLSKESDQYKILIEDIAKKITLVKKFLDVKRYKIHRVLESSKL